MEKNIVIDCDLLATDCDMCNNIFDNNRSDIMDREQQINELQKVICQHCFERIRALC